MKATTTKPLHRVLGWIAAALYLCAGGLLCIGAWLEGRREDEEGRR